MALNVLIVDDSGVMRAMILKTLRMTGIPLGEVYQAGNGQEGLEALNANWVDLVIADINMPVMNGEEMIDRMKENPETQDIPTVGGLYRRERDPYRKAPAQRGVHFVHKPFSPETIRGHHREIDRRDRRRRRSQR